MVDEHGRIMLPKELRETYEARTGDEAIIIAKNKELSIHLYKTPKDPLEHLIETSKTITIELSTEELKTLKDEALRGECAPQEETPKKVRGNKTCPNTAYFSTKKPKNSPPQQRRSSPKPHASPTTQKRFKKILEIAHAERLSFYDSNHI